MEITEKAELPDKQRTKSTPVDLDTILVEEIGQFGWFQMRTVLLAAVVVIFTCWGVNEYVFTTARIRTRCYISECDVEEPEFTPEWLLNAVPGTSLSSFDNCQRFHNTSNTLPVAEDVCPLEWFDRDQLKRCQRHVYENTHSVVYDYDLACDDWRRSLIGSFGTIGTLTGLPITGFVSDRFGRRTALTLNAFISASIGLLRYFANTYTGFVISEFVESMFGVFTPAYILTMEVVGPRFRVAAGASINSVFSIGQILLGLIAWGVPNWRKLTLVLYIPQLLTICYFWIISESPRWYMSKGRYRESEEVLKKIARVNKKSLSDRSLLALRQTTEDEKANQAELAEQKKNEPWLIVLVFRHKKVLLRCLVTPVCWISMTFVYYGLSINAVNLSGNRYLNYMAVSAAQIPGYWTAVFLLNKIGRKPVLIIAYWLCAACQIGYVFMPEDQYALSLTLYLVGTYCISTVVTSIYIYTAELYPTKYRHRLFAFSSMMGRIGSILAPLTPALGAEVWDKLPFALFAGFACLSGALIFITPETRGTKFPDSMEEADNIGRKKNENE